MATTRPPDRGIRGLSGLFMSLPTRLDALAELIHFFVRNMVKPKLNRRISPPRTKSSTATGRKSRKLARLVVNQEVTTDNNVESVNTAIFIASSIVSGNQEFSF
jgi:hypothetical protein